MRTKSFRKSQLFKILYRNYFWYCTAQNWGRTNVQMLVCFGRNSCNILPEFLNISSSRRNRHRIPRFDRGEAMLAARTEPLLSDEHTVVGARWVFGGAPRSDPNRHAALGTGDPRRAVQFLARARPIGGIPSSPHGHFGPESAQNQPSTACCVCCYDSPCYAATATSRELDSYFSLKSQQKQMRLESKCVSNPGAGIIMGIIRY